MNVGVQEFRNVSLSKLCDAFTTVFVDQLSDGSIRIFPCRVITQTKSQRQLIEVIESDLLGTVLVLDGELQLASSDEDVYHLAITNAVALNTRKWAKGCRALVLGGGDGCAARELLNHGHIEKCVIVDFDQYVLNLFRSQSLGQIFRTLQTFHDTRVEVVCSDATSFLERNSAKWHAVIVDLPDYYVVNRRKFGELLSLVRRRLTSGGVLALQAGPSRTIQPWLYDVLQGCRLVIIATHTIRLLSFGEDWTIVVAQLQVN